MNAVNQNPMRLIASIAEHARARPTSIAVIEGKQHLSYDELFARAQDLAQNLRSSGVLPDEAVGLVAKRGISTVVGMLAIFLAGAKYVPLDPGYPTERLAEIVLNTRITRVVGAAKWSQPFLDLGIDFMDAQGSSSKRLELELPLSVPSNGAYVIYTSGTSGRPKGVEIPRQALDHFCQVDAALYDLSRDDRVLQFVSISFDASVEEIFPPLSVGATVVIRDDGMIASPLAFLEECQELKLTVLHLPTAYWHELVDALVAEDLTLPSFIRLVSVGGEKISNERVRAWRALSSARHVRLLNAYGPTEVTVIATCDELAGPRVGESDDPTPSIGRPLGGMLVRIESEIECAVEVGEVGELLLGGPQTAIGYVGQPELTAAKFVTRADGHRYYRTGDRVRLRPDGRLEYLGRVDRQVKVRGYRVELAAVEEAIVEHSGVNEAVVCLNEQAQALWAFVLGDTALSTTSLEEHLRRRLAPHMVPSRLMRVERLPRTDRDKIDTAELIRQYSQSLAPARPETGEVTLAGIIREVLGCDVSTPHDTIFALGAHSLSVMRIASRIHRDFGVRISPGDVYLNPTISELEAFIAEQPRAEVRGIVENADEPVSLTEFQRDVWLAEQLMPGTAMHTICARFKITGETDPSAVSRALNIIVQRHDALRAVFRCGDGGPEVTFAPEAPQFEYKVADLRDARPDEQGACLGRLIDSRAQTVFEIEAGPLLAATYVHLADHYSELIVAVHHIAFDGWSTYLLARELADILGDQTLPAPRPFKDHLLDVAARAKQADNAAVQSFWIETLAGARTQVEFPLDHARPKTRSFNGARLKSIIPESLFCKIEDVARTAGTTTYAIVLACLYVVLSRSTGTRDVTILTPVANRDDAYSETTIGALVTVLPIRLSLHPNLTWQGAFVHVRETVLSAIDNKAVTISQAMKRAGILSRPDRGPLSQVMLILQNTPVAAAQCGALRIDHVETGFAGYSRLDLTFSLDILATGANLYLEYASELYEEATAQALLTSMIDLMSTAVEHVGSRIDTIEAAITSGSCRTPASQAIGRAASIQTVLSRMESHAREFPNDLAVTLGRETISYEALNAKANAIANVLVERGVSSGQVLALHMARTPLLFAALLAVWKVGGVFLPIDPEYPLERRRLLIDDAGPVAVIVCGRQNTEELGDVALIDVGAIGASGDVPSEISTNLEDSAYLIYTSGTTGQPKGVVVSQSSLAHQLYAWAEAYRLEPRQRHLQVASSSFDVFIGETTRALGTGGHLVICPREVQLDPKALFALMEVEKIEFVELVPTVLREFMAHVEKEGNVLGSVRLLAVGGEAWRVHEYRRARGILAPDARLVNSYGVTEATVDSAYFEGDVEGFLDEAPVPIGRPFDGSHLYVLDVDQREVPPGGVGELWIGGMGVAQRYHNRLKLTEERFRGDPFIDDDDARIYRTGDRACRRLDGLIEVLGRMDEQLKYNGHRIEPGEIEAACSAIPCVLAAAVDVRAGRHLVAYIVVRPGYETPLLVEIRDAVSRILPRHSIPTQVMVVEQLPKTPNGKLDRRALPDPDGSLRLSEIQLLPASAVEQSLADIWATLLETECVYLNDCFFELGGTSFTALRLTRAVEARFGQRLALLDIYRHTRLVDLAAHLEDIMNAPRGASPANRLLHELQKPDESSTRTLVCIPYAGAQAAVFQPMAKALGPDWQVLALQIPGRDWSRADEAMISFDQLAALCLQELQQLSGTIFLYGHCHGGALTIELARRAEELGIKIEGAVIGAMFPMSRMPGRLFDWLYRKLPIDRLVSDRAILEEIRALGGGLDEHANGEEQAFVMRAVRHDARALEEYFARTLTSDIQRLRAPVLSVVGERDRVTELYTERYEEWRHYADDVSLRVIPKAGHSFLTHQADQLGQIIDEWQPSRHDRADSVVSSHFGVVQKMAKPLAPMRDFWIVAFGQFVSLIGTSLTQLFLSIWVFQSTGRVTDYAFLSAISLLPGILIGPLAGAVADRYDRRLILLLSDMASGLATLGLIGITLTSGLHIWHVYAFCAVSSVANAFQRPAYLAAIAQLVPKAFLGAANGITQIGGGAGVLAGPLLAGGLIGALNLSQVLLADLSTFAIALITLVVVRIPNRLFRRREETMRSQLRNGWRYVALRPGLLSALKFFVIDHLIYMTGFSLIVPIVLIEHGASTLAAVLAAGGAGTVCGAVAQSIWGGTRRRTEGIVFFMMINAVALVMFGYAQDPLALAAAMFAMGASEALINGHWISLVQIKVGLELQGRVLSIFIAAMTLTMPLGYLIMGPLADLLFRAALLDGTPLAQAIGDWFGTGPARGLAFVVTISGLLLMAWSLIGAFNSVFMAIEATLPDAVPDAEIEDRDTIQKRADAAFVDKS
ncbi:non-ribosomal peptide synthetase/MFS transporter [Ensifer sp. YR511]|uniref:non-ribosomal peptide synthetase/MFS transporter n=1 Tax=Ensifer sp. YR511 TaxID=1855294 RepID=UPI00088C7E85|nr:non-ribosomal peptide synthetase/MFS transporter [Ensifer sp. YR511]SDN05259.1 amino acid adenylation domain-containing protein [Ensifer sp. YR511]